MSTDAQWCVFCHNGLASARVRRIRVGSRSRAWDNEVSARLTIFAVRTGEIRMAFIAFSLLLTLAIAGLVGLFVAYPNRGRRIPASIPYAEWLDDVMNRWADRITEYVEGPSVTDRK